MENKEDPEIQQDKADIRTFNNNRLDKQEREKSKKKRKSKMKEVFSSTYSERKFSIYFFFQFSNFPSLLNIRNPRKTFQDFVMEVHCIKILDQK